MASNLISGLVEWWRLDAANNANQVGLVSGTVLTQGQDGGTTTRVAGVVGHGVKLNAADTNAYLTHTGSMVNQGHARSFAVWVNVPAAFGLIGLVTQYRGTAPVVGDYDALVAIDDGTVSFGVEQEVSGGNVTADGPYPLDTWFHLVGTYDGTTSGVNTKLYLNGVLAASGVCSVHAADQTQKFEVGSLSDSGCGVDVLLNLLGVWNVALTPTQVASLYNSGAGLDYPFVPVTSKKVSDGKSF